MSNLSKSNFIVQSKNLNRGTLKAFGQEIECAIGKNGVILEAQKVEGDGKTPIGKYFFREVFYREDRCPPPNSSLKTTKIEPDFGWCDAANDKNYNKFITHPYPASAEKLWREDELYNIIVVLNHNNSPVVPNMGSAIFLHCAKPEYSPTEGCVAVYEADLQKLLDGADEQTSIEIIG